MTTSGMNRRTVLKAGALAAMPSVLARAETGPPKLAKAQAAQAVGGFTRPGLGVLALSRLGFGPAPADLEAFQKLGNDDSARLDAWLSQQLHPEKIDDGPCEERLKKFGSLNKSVEALWKEYYRGAPEGERKYVVIWQPVRDARQAALTRMVYSRRQLSEVLTGFWRDHFNVHPDKDERIPALLPHYDATLRQHALGNFRALLGAVAHHPAMLYYLDNASSTRGGPNENYARELFELHTLGAGHYRGVGRQSAVPGYAQGKPEGYVDDDVYEATRVLTGWRTSEDEEQGPLGDTGNFVFDPQAHDRFQKTVLGRYFPPNVGVQEGETLLDLLAAHPGTAQHVAQKLARRLIADDPPPELVQGAAKVFASAHKAPDQLAQVVSFLARSDAFKSSWGNRMRRPLEGAAAVMRVLGTDLKGPEKPEDDLWQLGWMGQDLYDWRPPNGAPDRHGAWSGSAHMLRRWQLARALPGNWWKEIQTDVPGATPQDIRTPQALTDYWAKRILGQPLPARSREVVVQHLKGDGDAGAEMNDDQRRDRLPSAVAFILMTPEFLLG
jgi:uncharacterized protein (DUF1800 family)